MGIGQGVAKNRYRRHICGADVFEDAHDRPVAEWAIWFGELEEPNCGNPPGAPDLAGFYSRTVAGRPDWALSMDDVLPAPRTFAGQQECVRFFALRLVER